MRKLHDLLPVLLLTAGCSVSAAPDPASETAEAITAEQLADVAHEQPSAFHEALATRKPEPVQAPKPPPDVYVGGVVFGYYSTGLILMNGDKIALWVNGNGEFRFHTPMPAGSAYEVTIRQQPTDGTRCTIEQGAGVAEDNVANIHVICDGVDPNAQPSE